MKTKKSKFLVTLLLCLTFVLALTPLLATTVAAGSKHAHCICGKTDCTDSTHGTAIIFNQVLTASSSELTTGNYYLTDNVKLAGTLTVPTGATVNLCLNGYALQGNGTDRVIYVSEGSSLNLCDCNGSHSAHKFTVNGTSKLWEYAGDWGVSDTESTDVKKVTGGVITGGNLPAGDRYGGGGVFIFEQSAVTSTVNMFNITIAGNNSTGMGGGVYNYYGTLNMYNVTVVGNTASCGAGIANTGNPGGAGCLSVYGGTISDNVASETGNVGGGGGIWTSGDTVLKDVTVSGNTVKTSGGGIHADQNVALHMTNTVISGNTAGLKGGGVYGAGGCKVNISGKVRIVDNTANSVRNNLELTRHYEEAFMRFPEVDNYASVCVVGVPDKDTSIGITRIPVYAQGGVEEPYPIMVIEGSDGATPYLLSSTDLKYFFGDNALQHIAYNDSTSCMDLAEGAPVPMHTHSWSYAANGNTVTATCGDADCEYHTGVSISLAATACGKTYNGSPCTAATIDGVDEWETAGLTAPAIRYEGVGPTSYASSPTPPTNAGTYRVSITMDTVTVYSDFTIARIEQNVKVAVVSYLFGNLFTPYEVDGYQAKENPTITYYYNTVNSNEGGTPWTELTGTTLNHGTYYLYAVCSQTTNYNAYTTPTSEFAVYPLSINASQITAQPVVVTYDGEEHGVTVAVDNTLGEVTVHYGTEQKSCNADQSPKYKNVSPDGFYTVFYRISKFGYEDYISYTSVTIQPKAVSVTPNSGLGKIYGDGDDNLTFTYNASDLAVGDSLVGVLDRESGEDAGQYDFLATSLNEAYANYTISVAAGSPKFTIEPRPVSLVWSASKLTYKGIAVPVKVTATAEDIASWDDADSLNIQYTTNDDFTNTAAAVGSYTAKAVIGNPNYELSGDDTHNWQILYHQAADATALSTPTSGWYASDVVLVPPAGYEIGMNESDWLSELSGFDDGKDQVITYYLRNLETGYVTGPMTKTLSVDQSGPDGKIVITKDGEQKTYRSSDADDDWFYDGAVLVELTAADDLSGLAKLEYQKVPQPLDTLGMQDGDWTPVDGSSISFTIQPNETFVIYLRATDTVGNTTMISTPLNVVYTNVSTTEYSADFTKVSPDDVTVPIQFNGNEVYEEFNIDGEGEWWFATAEYCQIQSDRIVFHANALQDLFESLNLELGEHTIHVYYAKALGVEYQGYGDEPAETEITLHFVKSTGTAEITNTLDKVYDQNAVVDPVITKDSSAAAVITYKRFGEDDLYYTTEKPKDAGKYTVKVFVPADDNYSEVTVTEDFTIRKAPGSITVINLSDLSMTYCGSMIDNPTPSFAGTGGATFLYKRKDAPDSTYNDNKPMEAGVWVILAIVAEDSNYEEATFTGEITISPKDITGALITLGDACTYNGNVQTQTVESVTIDGLSVTYTVSGNTQTNAGLGYTLTVTGTDNYTGTASVTWRIAKQQVHKPSADATAFVYNGQNQTYTIAADERYTVAGTQGKDAKDYTATVTLKDTNNFEWTDQTTAALSFNWTIAKKDIAGAVIRLDKTVLTENGNAQTQGIESVQVDGLGVTYDVTGNTETVAGAYTILVTANGNFIGTATQKFVILPKTEQELQKEINTDGKEVVVIGDGNIHVDAKKDTEATPDTKIVTDKKDVIENLLDGAELAKVASGDTANIWVNVKDATDDASKEQIQAKLNETGDLTVGAYIDISLFKKLASEAEPTQVHNLTKSIKVSVVIPEYLIKTARTFSIVRNHAGTVEILNGEFDAATGTFTFETDKFSDYGIAYEDHCVICRDRAPLFLGLCWLAWLLIVAVVAASATAVVVILKKKATKA